MQLYSLQSAPAESSDTAPSDTQTHAGISSDGSVACRSGRAVTGRTKQSESTRIPIYSVSSGFGKALFVVLPIRHKTAEVVAATLFDEVITRVSVSSAILTDRGGEFLGEVVEMLYKRLGMTHLKTSAYRPQTDAKCERVHYSVHNMITKLVDDRHERCPDLLGTVALAYNATVHTSTGYSPHELFYSFAPACP